MASINGTGRADILSGTPQADVIWAGSGDDQVSGRAGHDRLYGQAGADRIRGGDGNDRIGGGFGDDRLFGDGGDGNDLLNGNSGDDVLRGGAGADVLDGGAGNDLVYGGPGLDRLLGGPGIDTVSFAEETHGMHINVCYRFAADGNPEAGSVHSEEMVGFERIRGSAFDDTISVLMNEELDRVFTPFALFGLDGDDVINGAHGGDEIEGNGGNDSLSGYVGNDRVDGGAGDDHVNGGAGAGDDRLTGGAGSDVLYYGAIWAQEGSRTGSDIVTDFTKGPDRLYLTVDVEDIWGEGTAPGIHWQNRELFDVLDTNQDDRLNGLDQFLDSRIVEGVRSLQIDVAGLIDANLDDAHVMKGMSDNDRLTLLGVDHLVLQDMWSR
ncbi:calcium-binding protein [Geminicoccus harenae]|uniref:calcium-binding protein n=1 Tax=Geminicoccus harenae TaxID=2498453 RepID=UPI00168BB8F1|nr:calcium-binding protein [Geminicoccus harenae]